MRYYDLRVGDLLLDERLGAWLVLDVRERTDVLAPIALWLKLDASLTRGSALTRAHVERWRVLRGERTVWTGGDGESARR